MLVRTKQPRHSHPQLRQDVQLWVGWSCECQPPPSLCYSWACYYKDEMICKRWSFQHRNHSWAGFEDCSNLPMPYATSEQPKISLLYVYSRKDRYMCVRHQKLVSSHRSTSVLSYIFNVVVSTRWCHHFFYSSSNTVHCNPNFLIEVIASHQSCHFAPKLSLHPVKEEVLETKATRFLCLFSSL
jgi:hypothetical protein